MLEKREKATDKCEEKMRNITLGVAVKLRMLLMNYSIDLKKH